MSFLQKPNDDELVPLTEEQFKADMERLIQDYASPRCKRCKGMLERGIQICTKCRQFDVKS